MLPVLPWAVGSVRGTGPARCGGFGESLLLPFGLGLEDVEMDGELFTGLLSGGVELFDSKTRQCFSMGRTTSSW